MIKPIETWTETFTKLGHRVRRIWHSGIWDSGQQPNHEYRFDGFEQLEERQMLSGPGGDDLGSGGTSTGGATDNGGYGGVSLPPAFSGIGDFTNGISVPEHWDSVLPGGYSWGSANIFTYQPTTEGTYTYTSFTSDADDETDADANSVVVSRYSFTITVDWEGDVYSEVIDGHLSQYIVATDDTDVRDSVFSDSFAFGNYGYINFESDLDYSFKQTYSQSILTGIDVTISESNDTVYNWTAFNHKHLEPDSVSSYTSDATFNVAGASHGNSSGQFHATLSEADVSFTTSGGGNSSSGSRGATEPGFITQTYSGTTAVESGDIDSGAEGKRETLTLNGTVKNKFSSSYSFDGSGTISNQSGANLATSQITKTGSGNTHFINNLESTFDSEEVLINVTFLGMEGAESETGSFTSGSGFRVNLADDDEIRNTNTTEVHAHKIDHSYGGSSFNENRTINQMGDGRTEASPNPNVSPDQKGLNVSSITNVDVQEDGYTETSIRTNNGAGFTLKSIRIENDSHTTGTSNASVSNQVSEIKSNPNDASGLIVRVGTIQNNSDEDLDTTGTSKQTITIESLQHVTLGGGATLLNRPSGGDSSEGGTDSGGDSGNLQGAGDGTDGDLPTPDGASGADFNDYRKNVVTINLITLEEIDDHLNVSQTFDADGVITLVDNSYGNSTTTYQYGSYIDSTEDRNHTPTENLDENVVVNQGVTSNSHSQNHKEIFGNQGRGYTNTNLTSVLTPIVETTDDSSSDDGDVVTASTENLGGEVAQEYDFAVTGTTVASSNGNLSGVITGSGNSSISHWSTEGTGNDAVLKTLQVYGDWTLNGTSNTTGERTTTTNHLADEKLSITYTGVSTQKLSTTKNVNSDSARGESSGDLPPDMIDPHSQTSFSDDEFGWINDSFMANPETIFDFNFDSDSVDNTTINNERDKFQGTFSIEKSTENASTQIQTDTFSSSNYNYELELTPKSTPTDSDGSGGEELAEPSVDTGSDTSAQIANYRDTYDVVLNGTVEEIDLANITNTTLSSQTVTVKLIQTQGTHPGSEDYWLGQAANGVLPEWANRHLVRSAMVDKSVVVSGEINTLVLDTSSTKFENGNAFTTTSGLPPRPTVDDGTGSMGGTGGMGGTNAPEAEHPFADLSSEMTVFHDAYDDLIVQANSANSEIEDQFTAGDDSGMGPTGPGGGDGDTGEASDSAPVYTIVSDHKHITHRQHVQELKFMDSLDMFHGYFSITDYTMDPSEGNAWSEKQSNFRIVNRDLTSTQSVDSYLDDMEAPPEEDAPAGTESGTSGDSGSSTATADSGGSGESSYTANNDATGKLRVQTDSSKTTDYQWKQTEKVHMVKPDGTRHMTSQTKTAEFSHNHETSHSVQDTEFRENAEIDISKTNAKYELRVWKVSSIGNSKLRGIIYDSDRNFHSSNEGGGWFATARTSNYTIASGSYSSPTYSGNQQAAAAVTGHIYDETTDTFAIDPTLTSNQSATRTTIVETNETAYGNPVYQMIGGGYFEVVDLAQRIMLNRKKEGTTTYTFTLLPDATVPINSTDPGKEWGAILSIGEFKTYSFGNLTDEVEYHAIATTVGTRLMGFVTLVGGVAEVAAGVALTQTGLGAPFGVIAIVHGIDTLYAGSTQLLGGGESRTLTAQLGSAAFMQGIAFHGANEITDQEREAAKSFGDAVDVVVGLADMGAGAVKAIAKMSKAAKAADTLTGVRSITNAADNLDEASRLRKAANQVCENGECFIAGVPVATIAASKSGNLLLASSPSLWLPELELPKHSGLWTVEVAAVGGVILATTGMLKKVEPKSKSASRLTRKPEETDFAPGQLVYY